jgi:nucleoid-associated protein YgaU
MGIFSFVKSIGEKLFGSGLAQAAQPSAPTNQEIQNALNAKIAGLGLKVDGLNISFADGQASVYGTAATQKDRELTILAIGNSEGVAQVEDNITVAAPEPQARFYTVVSGDNLSKISKAHYGDPNKYMKIFEANKPMLTHPDKIFPGQVLRIPD